MDKAPSNTHQKKNTLNKYPSFAKYEFKLMAFFCSSLLPSIVLFLSCEELKAWSMRKMKRNKSAKLNKQIKHIVLSLFCYYCCRHYHYSSPITTFTSLLMLFYIFLRSLFRLCYRVYVHILYISVNGFWLFVRSIMLFFWSSSFVFVYRIKCSTWTCLLVQSVTTWYMFP